MKLGSSEEQTLKLLITGNDINGATVFAECMTFKDIKHLVYKSIHRLDPDNKIIFLETLCKNPKLLSILKAKLILKKDCISYEEASQFLKSMDIALIMIKD